MLITLPEQGLEGQHEAVGLLAPAYKDPYQCSDIHNRLKHECKNLPVDQRLYSTPLQGL